VLGVVSCPRGVAAGCQGGVEILWRAVFALPCRYQPCEIVIDPDGTAPARDLTLNSTWSSIARIRSCPAWPSAKRSAALASSGWVISPNGASARGTGSPRSSRRQRSVGLTCLALPPRTVTVDGHICLLRPKMASAANTCDGPISETPSTGGCARNLLNNSASSHPLHHEESNAAAASAASRSPNEKCIPATASAPCGRNSGGPQAERAKVCDLRDFHIYAAGVSQSKRMALISAGVNWSGWGQGRRTLGGARIHDEKRASRASLPLSGASRRGRCGLTFGQQGLTKKRGIRAATGQQAPTSQALVRRFARVISDGVMYRL